MADAMRTPSGAPSQTAREKHGDKQGKFPIFDHKSAHSALMLRGHADDPAAVIARVRAWAREHGDKAILAECDAVTEADKKQSAASRSAELVVEKRGAAMRDVDFGQRIITAVAVPYEHPAEVSYRQEVWNEVFSRSAFKGISERTSRIPVNREHNPEHLVGKVVSTYPDRDEGLVCDIYCSRTERGDDTLELARDDVLSLSVGFMVKNPYMDQQLDRHTRTRRINRAFLDHLAFVGVPAYDDAKVLAMRNCGDSPEADLPPLAFSRMEDFVSDPIFQWANSRMAR